MKTLDRLPLDAPLSGSSYSAAELAEDNGAMFLLDQRALPGEETYFAIDDLDEAAWAIRAMVVRGAPAIGVAAAYALAVFAGRAGEGRDRVAALAAAGRVLEATRPTAVNLAWAVGRMVGAASRLDAEGVSARAWAEGLAGEARALHREDVAACRVMGELGADLLPEGATVLTHCNAGALATGGFGTALGVIRAAHRRGKIKGVLADETRPYLQGARLTAWELARDGVPVEVVTDGMAGHFMQRGEVGAVVVGADRVARSGDVANKIGTYGLAVLARAHAVPFFVAAPWSTVDLACVDGGAIPIEERSSDEVTEVRGVQVAPRGVRARHPAFDVTPARLVTALVTERGVVVEPSERGLCALSQGSGGGPAA